MKFCNSIWITWERQRRSIELANALNTKLYILESSIHFAPRYIFLLLRTLLILIKEKPKIVFGQNPSIVLAALLCILKKIFDYKLIIDRHSNFKLATLDDKKVKWRIFHYLSKFSIRKADLTIVTNNFLHNLVNSWGGRGFILQDKLPELNLGSATRLNGEKNIVFISTFSNDEPIEEVIEASKKNNSNWIIYITGNYKNYKKKDSLLNNLPSNIRLTGFLPEKDYQSLLISADLLMVLTTAEHTLTCGAYEGVSISKPLIVSDTEAIRNYFYKGVVYTKPDSNSIATAIKNAVLNIEMLKKDIIELKGEISIDWNKRFNRLRATVDELKGIGIKM